MNQSKKTENKNFKRFYFSYVVPLGFNPLLFFRSLKNMPRFFSNTLQFLRIYKGTFYFLPCLHDFSEQSGSTKNEYFSQDLLVARWVYTASPKKHLDIGSRVDGLS